MRVKIEEGGATGKIEAQIGRQEKVNSLLDIINLPGLHLLRYKKRDESNVSYAVVGCKISEEGEEVLIYKDGIEVNLDNLCDESLSFYKRKISLNGIDEQSVILQLENSKRFAQALRIAVGSEKEAFIKIRKDVLSFTLPYELEKISDAYNEEHIFKGTIGVSFASNQDVKSSVSIAGTQSNGPVLIDDSLAKSIEYIPVVALSEKNLVGEYTSDTFDVSHDSDEGHRVLSLVEDLLPKIDSGASDSGGEFEGREQTSHSAELAIIDDSISESPIEIKSSQQEEQDRSAIYHAREATRHDNFYPYIYDALPYAAGVVAAFVINDLLFSEHSYISSLVQNYFGQESQEEQFGIAERFI